MFGKLRDGFSMQVTGIQLNRPDLHTIAADLGIATRDVLFSNGVLSVYNTSQECQKIIDDNALFTFIAMAIEISPEQLSDLQAIKEEKKVIEFDFDDEDED
jgi:hypothetical protein